MNPVKTLCGGMAVACAFSIGGLPLAANAREIPQKIESVTQRPHPNHHHYDVYYLPADNDKWRFHASYNRLDDAREAASQLEQNGLLARIRHHR